MSKLSDKERRVLTFIVTNCEIYRLNENESMKLVREKLGRPISRRTYYNYKNQIYKNHEKNTSYFGILKNTDFEISRDVISLSLMYYKNDLIEDGLKENIKLDEFDRLDTLPQYFTALYIRGQTFIDQSNKFLNRVKSKSESLNRNYESIPDKATVREEYIKCGKDFCLRCPHGPYYYAYWKENKKLKKKYLGSYNPRQM
jgi:hypothetical protein